LSSTLRRVSAAELPPPPRLPSRGATGARRTPRERGLTREAIVDAALAIVDREGLDALTMRAVAQALGTGAASLYAHVDSKDELLEMLIERVLGEVRFPEAPDPARWVEQLKEMGRDVRRVWAAHRDLARASFARIPLGPNALRGSESMLAVMRAGGLSDRAIGLGSDLLALYIGAVSYEESLQPSDEWTPERMGEFVAALRDYFGALPVERFPNLVALAGALTDGDGETRFDFGLEVLTRGLIAISQDT
jgi:AcrR family transcriptional regulator